MCEETIWISIIILWIKTIANALAYIEAFVNDNDLVDVTLHDMGKHYSQFWTSIVVWKTFVDFVNS
jgi:hypothetical protein